MRHLREEVSLRGDQYHQHSALVRSPHVSAHAIGPAQCVPIHRTLSTLTPRRTATPHSLTKETTHRYGSNSFKLHRLPMPRPAQVLGLVGTNGIGKSTALKVLKGNLKPNLGMHDSPPTWEDILKHFRGSELQNYFQRVLEEKLKALIKPQYVDHIPKAAKGTVGPLLRARDERRLCETMLVELQLDHVQSRDLEMLSGGELQRFAIAMVAVQEADVYMFDEPSSYLDVRQRLKAANVIRALTGRVDAVDDEGEKLEATSSGTSTAKYVVVVEHDLAVLDYLSDFSAFCFSCCFFFCCNKMTLLDGHQFDAIDF